MEFIGLARQFRSTVKLVDIEMEAALATITQPLIARLKRKPTLRAETLPVIAQEYRTLIPARFRIGRVEGTRHRTEFAIVERRLCASWLRDDAWDDAEVREPGLTICRFVLTMHKGRLRQRWVPLVAVSLHAMARRVERSVDRSHASLERDLTVLADAGEDGDRVNTPGGFWLGSVIDANGDGGIKLRLRSVRTWINNTDG